MGEVLWSARHPVFLFLGVDQSAIFFIGNFPCIESSDPHGWPNQKWPCTLLFLIVPSTLCRQDLSAVDYEKKYSHQGAPQYPRATLSEDRQSGGLLLDAGPQSMGQKRSPPSAWGVLPTPTMQTLKFSVSSELHSQASRQEYRRPSARQAVSVD